MFGIYWVLFYKNLKILLKIIKNIKKTQLINWIYFLNIKKIINYK